MAWISSFLLGRPGYEVAFEVNPVSMRIDHMPLVAYQRNLAGDLKRATLKAAIPTIQVASNFLSISQRNQFASFAEIMDTFLSFQTRDDWQSVLKYHLPTDTTHVTLENSSMKQLDLLLASLGFSTHITVTGVFTVPDGSGTNYYSSYNHATGVITLSALPGTNPVYVTYTYKGWLVSIEKVGHTYQGGWVDRAIYDFQLIGV